MKFKIIAVIFGITGASLVYLGIKQFLVMQHIMPVYKDLGYQVTSSFYIAPFVLALPGSICLVIALKFFLKK